MCIASVYAMGVKPPAYSNILLMGSSAMASKTAGLLISPVKVMIFFAVGILMTSLSINLTSLD